jgi:FKBP-type peptidyl-prolyl cis-trans isomerase SlyD
MQIGKDTVVSISYDLFDASGKLIEKTPSPVSYLHGGYDAIFPEDISVGMQVEGALEGDHEQLVYTVTDIAEDRVVVDGNHALSGQVLVFICTVTEVREATSEELAHGHVHGPHGHQH